MSKIISVIVSNFKNRVDNLTSIKVYVGDFPKIYHLLMTFKLFAKQSIVARLKIRFVVLSKFYAKQFSKYRSKIRFPALSRLYAKSNSTPRTTLRAVAKSMFKGKSQNTIRTLLRSGALKSIYYCKTTVKAIVAYYYKIHERNNMKLKDAAKMSIKDFIYKDIY